MVKQPNVQSLIRQFENYNDAKEELYTEEEL